MRTFLFGLTFTALFVFFLSSMDPVPVSAGASGGAVPVYDSVKNESGTSSVIPYVIEGMMSTSSTQTKTSPVAKAVSLTKSVVRIPLEQFRLSLTLSESVFNDYLTGFTRCGFAHGVYEACSVSSTDRGYGIVIGSVRDGWVPTVELFLTDASLDKVAAISYVYAGKTRMTYFAATQEFKQNIVSRYQLESNWGSGVRHGIFFIHPVTRHAVVIMSDGLSEADMKKMAQGIVFQK